MEIIDKEDEREEEEESVEVIFGLESTQWGSWNDWVKAGIGIGIICLLSACCWSVWFTLWFNYCDGREEGDELNET